MSITLSEEFEAAKTLSVDSHGRAVVYSGNLNHDRAVDYATRTGAIPLDRTDAGRKLDGVYDRNKGRYSKEVESRRVSNNVMSVASKRYAQRASGNVKTFVCGARSDSVFRKTELPILLKNPRVTSINGIDRNVTAY